MENENIEIQKLTLKIVLFGNPIPPNEISKRLGVKATTALFEGERNNKINLPRKNLWVLESLGGYDINEEWQYLKKTFGKKWNEFIEIIRLGGSKKISIVVKISDNMPPIIIPISMIKDVSDIGADIHVDC